MKLDGKRLKKTDNVGFEPGAKVLLPFHPFLLLAHTHAQKGLIIKID